MKVSLKMIKLLSIGVLGQSRNPKLLYPGFTGVLVTNLLIKMVKGKYFCFANTIHSVGGKLFKANVTV